MGGARVWAERWRAVAVVVGCDESGKQMARLARKIGSWLGLFGGIKS